MTIPKVSDLNKAFGLFGFVLGVYIIFPQDWIRDMCIASFGVVIGGLQAHLRQN